MSGREELRELVGAARALVEWHEGCGTDALPPAPKASRPARPVAPPPAGPGAAAIPAPRQTLRSVEPAVTGDERRTRLAVLADKVTGCKSCVLHERRTQTAFSRGNPDAEIMFVGEGPGADEDAQGLPFVGKAGQLLDKMIAAMGLDRERDVYVANVVKCRPPDNRTPLPVEMASCLPYLTEQIELVRPKVIVVLGSTALRGLLGPGEGITKARGVWKLYRGTIPVMPTFHPAYVLRTPTREVKGMVWSDLQQVLKQLGREVPKRRSD